VKLMHVQLCSHFNKTIAWYLVHNSFTLIGNVGYHACKFWKDTLKVGSFLKDRKENFQCKKYEYFLLCVALRTLNFMIKTYMYMIACLFK
jgi:hypothetical protein